MSKGNLVTAVGVFAVTAAAFAACVGHGLCHCDDACYLLYRHEIADGLSLRGIGFVFGYVEQCIWMPLTYLSYMFERTLGIGWGGMHATSVLWHAGCAVLLFFLLARLFGNRTVAFLAALSWAVHPLRVESVVWLASRKDVISTFFFLAALLAWERGTMRAVVLALALVAAGAMAKPSVMVFPAYALALDFLVTGRRKPAAVYGTLFALSVVIAVEASVFQRMGGAGALSDLIPTSYRLLNALASVTVYLGNVVWPDRLAMQCMIRYPDMPRFSILGLSVLLVLTLALAAALFPRLERYRRTGDAECLLSGSKTVNAVGAGVLVFFAALVPFLGLSGFGIHAFADRFTLLPAIGLSLSVAAAAVRIPRAAVPILALAVVALGVRTVGQVGYWRDTETLLTHTLEVDREQNVDAQRSLGVYHWDETHDMERSYRHLSKAMEHCWCDYLRDQVGVSCHFLVDSAYATGRKEEAEEWYYWMRKWDRRQDGSGDSPEFQMAEILWNLNSNKGDGLKDAEEVLESMRRNEPDGYLTRYADYVIAVRRGDPKKIAAALAACPRPQGVQCSNAWAVRILAAGKVRP